jgi:ABC-type dipeptide/oligopeptide/nickel transport system permease subunit
MTAAAEPLAEAPDALAAGRDVGLWRDTLRALLRQRSAVVGMAILTFLALVALLAPLAPYAPNTPLLGAVSEVNPGNPSGRTEPLDTPCIHILGCPADQPEHFMGIDTNVRDVFSRVVWGTRISLTVGFVTVGFAIVVGALLGAIAGFAGGWLDNAIMRVMDVLLVFPALILAILIVSVLGPALVNAMLAIGVVAIPVYARIMRASVLSVREQDYVTAARALGESSVGILLRRVIPNALTPIIVAGTLGIGGAVLDVAALSFIGLGAQRPEAEWGAMIGLERNRVFSAPHLLFFPGLALTFTVLAFNLLGDGLRDALDPRLNR